MSLIDVDKINFNETAQDTRNAAQTLIDSQPTVKAIKVGGELIDITGKGTTIMMNNTGGICLFLAHDKKTNPENYRKLAKSRSNYWCY